MYVHKYLSPVTLPLVDKCNYKCNYINKASLHGSDVPFAESLDYMYINIYHLSLCLWWVSVTINLTTSIKRHYTDPMSRLRNHGTIYIYIYIYIYHLAFCFRWTIIIKNNDLYKASLEVPMSRSRNNWNISINIYHLSLYLW